MDSLDLKGKLRFHGKAVGMGPLDGSLQLALDFAGNLGFEFWPDLAGAPTEPENGTRGSRSKCASPC